MRSSCRFLGVFAVAIMALAWASAALANQPPEFDQINDTTITEKDFLALAVSASDPDGPAPSLATDGMPANSSFVDNGDGTGTFNFQPDYDQAGVYNVTFIASDGALADTEIVEITVNEKNRSPVLNPIGKREVTEGFNLNFDVSAYDPDGVIPLLSVHNLPAYATFADHGDGTGTFDFNPVEGDTHKVIFLAYDGSRYDQEEVTIVVLEDPGIQDSVTIDIVNAVKYGNDSVVVAVLVHFDQENTKSGTIPVFWEPNDYWEYDTAYFVSERWTGSGKPDQLAINHTTLSTVDSSGVMISWSSFFISPPPGEDTIVTIHFHANPSQSNPTGLFRMHFLDWFPPSNTLQFVHLFGYYWNPAGKFVDGIDSLTAVLELPADQSGIPREFALYQNYPNPFNAGTTIEFAIRRDGHVKLEIFNILGQKVATPVDEHLTAGLKRAGWDGTDAMGKVVGSGMYFYRLTAGEYVEMKKMILMK